MTEHVRRLEEITLNSSSALRQQFYDGWILRFSPGSEVKRSNSVTALYPSTLAVAAKIAYCEQAYAGAGLPTRFRLNASSLPAQLDRLLAERGYRKIEPTLVMLLPLRQCAAQPVAPGFAVKDLDEWITLSSALRGKPRETLEARRQRLASAPVSWFPVTLTVAAQTVCSGIGGRDGEYFGLFDLFTPEALRRRGYSTALAISLIETARASGASYAYLQVDEANGPARRIYERLGFCPVYTYWYRTQV